MAESIPTITKPTARSLREPVARCVDSMQISDSRVPLDSIQDTYDSQDDTSQGDTYNSIGKSKDQRETRRASYIANATNVPAPLIQASIRKTYEACVPPNIPLHPASTSTKETGNPPEVSFNDDEFSLHLTEQNRATLATEETLLDEWDEDDEDNEKGETLLDEKRTVIDSDEDSFINMFTRAHRKSSNPSVPTEIWARAPNITSHPDAISHPDLFYLTAFQPDLFHPAQIDPSAQNEILIRAPEAQFNPTIFNPVDISTRAPTDISDPSAKK